MRATWFRCDQRVNWLDPSLGPLPSPAPAVVVIGLSVALLLRMRTRFEADRARLHSSAVTDPLTCAASRRGLVETI